MKYDRSLSLVDCFTIPTGEVLEIEILLARREKELERLNRKPFGWRSCLLGIYPENAVKRILNIAYS